MAEKTEGVYQLVTIPLIYRMFQEFLGAKSAKRYFKQNYFNDLQNKRVLEVGCGPGSWYPNLSDCAAYVGMDWNKDHIERASSLYASDRAEFVVGDVSTDLPLDTEKFDYVFAFGVLHHLDDTQANALLTACQKVLGTSGKFVSIDPVYHEGQNFFSKWMCDRDSGQNIRTEAGYRTLALSIFENAETAIHTDRLRIPYSHCVMAISAQ
jgi:SAM-dependent methyltransferase